MTHERALARDRASALRSDWDRSLAIQLKIVDWRSACAWLAFAGALALSVSITSVAALGWLAFVAVIVAAVGYGILRRRRITALVAELVALAEADRVNGPGAESESWDRSRLDTIPEYYLQPVDAATPAQLERMVRLTPDALKAQFAEARAAMLTTILVGILGLSGICLAGLPLIGWLSQAVSAPGLPQLFPIPITVAMGLVAAAALVMPLVESAAMTRVGRVLAGYLARAASAELGRLWQVDPGFTTGTVVRWSPGGYFLDVTQMTLAPEPPARNAVLRTVAWVAIGSAVALLLFLFVLTTVAEHVFS